MSRLNAVPMPPRIARLPRNTAGYPTPWFVATLGDGTRDFRIADQRRFGEALRHHRCWICGEPTGRYVAFVIGPMCAVNRISAEPPSHRECAVYAAQVCPFLAVPTMRRRENGIPEGATEAAGVAIKRNPGVALVWVTRDFTAFRPPSGPNGLLCEMGDPTETLWFAHGRAATRAEVVASLDTGMPLLREMCDKDRDPADAHRELDEAYARAMELLPAEVAS